MRLGFTRLRKSKFLYTSARPASHQRIVDPMTLRPAFKTVGRNPVLSRKDAVPMRISYARLGEIKLQRGSPQAALLNYRINDLMNFVSRPQIKCVAPSPDSSSHIRTFRQNCIKSGPDQSE